MNCEEFSRHIDDYIENNLSYEMKADMENHILSCSKCISDLEFSKKIFDSLHNMTDRISVPEDFLEKLNKRIDSEESASKKKFIPDWRMFTGIAAAIIFTVVISNTDMPEIGKKNSDVSMKGEIAGIKNKQDESTDNIIHDETPDNSSEQSDELFSDINSDNKENTADTSENPHIPAITSSVFGITEESSESIKNDENNENNQNQFNIVSKKNILPDNADEQNIPQIQITDKSDNAAEVPQEKKYSDIPFATYDTYPESNKDSNVSEETMPSAKAKNDTQTAVNTLNDDKEISADSENNESTTGGTENNSGNIMRYAPAYIPSDNNADNVTAKESDISASDYSDDFNTKDNDLYKRSYSGNSGGSEAGSSSGSSGGGGGSSGSSGAGFSSKTPSSSSSASISAQYNISVSDIDSAYRIIRKYAQSSGPDYIIDRSDLSALYNDLSAEGISYSVSKEYDNGGNKIILKVN